jgi:hypothetical protein
VTVRPKRRLSAAQAASLTLALAAFGVVAAVIALPELGGGSGRVHITTAAPNETLESSGDTALTARFTGKDQYGRPFVVIADRIERDTDGSDRLRLFKPSAVMSLADGRKVDLSADFGLYRPAASTMDLSGKVILVDDTGYRVETSKASINLNEATATGNEPVVGRATFGIVRGTGFEVSGGGSAILVTGPANLDLTSSEVRLK